MKSTIEYAALAFNIQQLCWFRLTTTFFMHFRPKPKLVKDLDIAMSKLVNRRMYSHDRMNRFKPVNRNRTKWSRYSVEQVEQRRIYSNGWATVKILYLKISLDWLWTWCYPCSSWWRPTWRPCAWSSRENPWCQWSASAFWPWTRETVEGKAKTRR